MPLHLLSYWLPALYASGYAETTASMAAPLRKTKKTPCLLVLVALSFWTDMRDGDLCEHPTPFFLLRSFAMWLRLASYSLQSSCLISCRLKRIHWKPKWAERQCHSLKAWSGIRKSKVWVGVNLHWCGMREWTCGKLSGIQTWELPDALLGKRCKGKWGGGFGGEKTAAQLQKAA